MSDVKTIEIRDLKQGDILLFSPTADWESRLIALITKSPVSHAAMSYYDYNEIVEEIPPYTQVNSIKDRIVNRKITVMRLTPFNKDMSKVLDIAKNCVTNREPYTKMDLIIVIDDLIDFSNSIENTYRERQQYMYIRANDWIINIDSNSKMKSTCGMDIVQQTI